MLSSRVMTDQDNVELASVWEVTDKEYRISSHTKGRDLKKKNNQREKKGINRSHSPEWSIPSAMGNQVKREEAKADALPKFSDWSVTKMQPVKSKFRW